MFRFVVALAALLAPAAAFAPRASRALTRRSGISMSHFSTVQTQLKNKELLVKSLKDVNLNVIVAEHETMAVRGYQGETVQAELAIQQENGQDIGFRFNGQSFEMVADLQFWGQSMPVESFLEKVTQRYSVNAVLESAAEGGFSTNSFVTNQETGTVEIELSRYVV